MIYIIAVLLTVAMCVLHWKNRKFSTLARQFRIDSIASYPILGISYIFFGNSETQMKALELLGNLSNQQSSGVIGGWFGPRFYLGVSNPEIAELLLKTCLEKDDVYKTLSSVLGNGSIVASVPIWRIRRKNLIPLLSTRSLNNIVPLFIKYSEELVAQLKSKVGMGPFPIGEYLSTYSLSSIGCQFFKEIVKVSMILEAVFGAHRQTRKKEYYRFLNAVSESSKLIADRALQPWLHSDLVYKLIPDYRKLKKCKSVESDFIYEAIKLRREEIQTDTLKFGDHKDKVLLDQLIESVGYSDVELLEESLVLVLAAMDTSAITLGFTMLMLSRHPEVQERVYKELQEVFLGSEKPLALEDLQRLKYLEIVIKETLRLYQPAVVVLRKVTKDVTLPSGETVVEGCGILINIRALHRNPKYWGADADQFRPERFLDTPFKHHAQYMPFSNGPRNCPGYQYSLLSIKTMLATILRHYQILPATEDYQQKPISCTFGMTLKEKDNFVVRLGHRKNWE